MYGGLFWIEINQGDRMTVPYDQQDPLNYRNILYTELNLENKDISVIDNEQIIYQTVKQELLLKKELVKKEIMNVGILFI